MRQMAHLCNQCRLATARLLTVVCVLLVGSSAFAQVYGTQSGPNVDSCNLETVDGPNDVEETVCITGDSSQLDAYAALDSYESSDYANWPNGNPYVEGLAAEGMMSGSDGSSFDTGLTYGSLGIYDNSGTYPPPPNVGSSSITITPTLNVWYTIEGYYSECYDSTGAYSYCSWTSTADGGLSAQAQVTAPQPATVSLSTSITPAAYGQPVTFTATLSNGPAGSVTFYDGSYTIGTATISGNTATLTTNTLAWGNSHSITAVWPGSPYYTAATSNTVTQAITLSSNSIYSYVIAPQGGRAGGYGLYGDVLSYSDLVNGTWTATDRYGGEGYDYVGRLTALNGVAGNYEGLGISWYYDNFGNRTDESFSGTSSAPVPTSTHASYDGYNHVTQSSLMSNAGFGYDAAGNVTLDNQNQYLYDGDNRVCAIRNISSGNLTGYIYDAEGHRVAKGTLSSLSCDATVNGFQPTSESILGQSGEQVTELDGQGNWQHTNVYADNELMATYDTTGLHFQFSDWEGTRRVETDYAGNTQLTCSNLPFGNGAANCVTPTEQFFTGQPRDTESGNDAFPARYYSSTSARWLTPDPYDGSYDMLNPQSFNRYAYVSNNPLGFTDPSGLSTASTLCTIVPAFFLSAKQDPYHVIGNLSKLVGFSNQLAKNSCSSTLIAVGQFVGKELLASSLSILSNHLSSSSSSLPGFSQSAYFAYIQAAVAIGCSIDYNPTACGGPQLAWLIPGADGALGKTVGDLFAVGAAFCTAGGPGNPLCDVVALYILANSVYDFFYNLFGWGSSNQPPSFHGSLLPRPATPLLQGASSFGVPTNNLDVLGLIAQ